MIDLDNLVELALPVEMLVNALDAGAAHGMAQLGSAFELQHRVAKPLGEGFVGVGIDEDAAGFVEVVGGASPAGGDDGQAARHGFKHDRAAAFEQAGKDQNIGFCQFGGTLLLRHPAGEDDSIRDPQLLGEFRELTAQATIADELQHGSALGGDGLERLKQKVDGLPIHKPAEINKSNRLVGRLLLDRSGALPDREIDRVVENLDHVPTDAGGKCFSSSLVGDQDGLRVEFSWKNSVADVRDPAAQGDGHVFEPALARSESGGESHVTVQRSEDHGSAESVNHRRVSGRDRDGLVNHVDFSGVDELADDSALEKLGVQLGEKAKRHGTGASGKALFDGEEQSMDAGVGDEMNAIEIVGEDLLEFFRIASVDDELRIDAARQQDLEIVEGVERFPAKSGGNVVCNDCDAHAVYALLSAANGVVERVP